jgi:hypothetical protein
LAQHAQDGFEATRRMAADENHSYRGVDNLAVAIAYDLAFAIAYDLGHRRNAAIKELTNDVTV